MNHVEHCDALEVEVERFAVAMSQLPSDTMVETCPGWTVDDTAQHLGVIHRWAEELVRTRSTVRIPRATPSLDDTRVSPEWIRNGGARLVETLRSADPNDEMWAWGLDQHVRFWSRRQVHETLVHRMDLELAARAVPKAAPDLASDAIDEFLSNLEKVVRASTDSTLRGSGERLALKTNDSKAKWSVTLVDEGFSLALAPGEYDTLVEGPSTELLLLIVGRRSLRDASIVVTGDVRLLEFWLANSAFE